MKRIIISLFILTSFNSMAQTPTGPASAAGPGAPKGPARPKNVYLDKDGDTVTVIDYELRKKLNSVKDVKPSLVYDSSKEIEKARAQMESNILSNKAQNFRTYTVDKETDLRDLSTKLYGSPKRWAELQVFNEETLKSSTLSPGMKLKYIVDAQPAPRPVAPAAPVAPTTP